MRVLLTAALLTLTPSLLKAQTLTETVQQALRHHPAIRAAHAEADAAGFAARQAADRLHSRVTLAAELGRSTLSTPAPFPESGARWPNALSLVWNRPLYSGGTLEAGRSAALHDADAQRHGLQDTRVRIAVDAIAVHAAVVRDQALLALHRESLRSLQALRHDTEKRFQAGEATRTDVAQAQARLAEGDARLARLQADLAISEGDYRRVTGEAPRDLEQDYPDLPLPPTPEAAQAQLLQNPQLRAAREHRLALDAALDAARGGNRPQLSVEARAATQDDSDFGYDRLNAAGIYLKAHLNLYDSGHTRHAIGEAQARAEAARWRENELLEQLRQAMTAAWEHWRAADAGQAAARNETAAAELARDSARKELAVGTRTTLDVLNAERDLLDARTRLLLHEQEHRLSAYRILAVIGDLSLLNRPEDVRP